MSALSAKTSDPGPGERRLLLQRALLGATALIIGNSGTAAEKPVSLPAGDSATNVPIPKQSPAYDGLARLKNVGLWYWDTGGSGQTVVLLHAITGSGLAWPYQQPVFAQSGYRVIGYSRRGHRNSESGPKDPGTGSEDLLELLDLLGIDRFHAVATAGGAFVATDFAVSHPERLHSLVLSCSLLGVEDNDVAAITKQLIPAGFFENTPAEFRELSPSYRSINPGGTAEWIQIEKASMAGQRVRQPLKNAITLASLRQIKVPTCLIFGDADLLTPPPVGRLFARNITGAELNILPECGHSAYWEQPQAFNKLVLDFLSRQNG